jgi:hypothetical protein
MLLAVTAMDDSLLKNRSLFFSPSSFRAARRARAKCAEVRFSTRFGNKNFLFLD